MAWVSADEFSFMQDGNAGGAAGLTSNQKSVLSSGGDSELCSAVPGCDSLGWRVPLTVVGLFSFVGFVLGCVATDLARGNTREINHAKEHPKPDACSFGDQTFGAEVHVGHKGGSAYQVVGAHGAPITWQMAMQDAKNRCYNGYQGYLAVIGSQEENDFLHNLSQSTPTYENGDMTWIGATDTHEEGTFAWLGPQKMSQGVVFWTGGLEGHAVAKAYSNWAPGEPNSGGLSQMDEDCVAMLGGGVGRWIDRNCYQPLSFFAVEFGPPEKVMEVWEKEHEGDAKEAALDDDQLIKDNGE